MSRGILFRMENEEKTKTKKEKGDHRDEVRRSDLVSSTKLMPMVMIIAMTIIELMMITMIKMRTLKMSLSPPS